jgi:hypothetical protein
LPSQESEFTKLPMITCSDTIEKVSLSGVLRLTQKLNSSINISGKVYKNRKCNENLSPHLYFDLVKNTATPTASREETIPQNVGFLENL